MEDNPYSALAALFSGTGPALMLFSGRVKSKTPLTIIVENLELSGSDLQLNAAMLPHTADVQLPDIGTVQAEITPSLEAGDEVLLLSTDGQVFFVLCKVVSS